MLTWTLYQYVSVINKFHKTNRLNTCSFWHTHGKDDAYFTYSSIVSESMLAENKVVML